MSFIGAINAEVRRWLGNVSEHFNDRFVVIGCSGNFTVEQILTRYAKPKYIWSNDISLYSSVLGAYLTDQPISVKINETDLLFLEPFMESIEDTTATIMILSEALKYEGCKNLYQKRIWNHYQKNFAHYHQHTIDKIKSRKEQVKIDRYTSWDISKLLNEIPGDSVIIAFMPTYAGGYEKLYTRMEEVFSWDRPEYKIIDAEIKQNILNSMTQLSFIYIDDQKREDLPLAAIAQKRGLKTVYLYSNFITDNKAYMRQKISIDQTSFECLSEEHDIYDSSKISIIPTTNNVINYFRNLYLKKGIDYVNGDACFLVFVDKKLFGFLIFVLNRFQTADIYLLSDFVIPIASYPRLSKLLLLISRSDRVQDYLQQKYLKQICTILTTAFTDKPVSMKYRGIYKLHSRKEGRLNYIAETGSFKLKDIISLWLKKYHKKK